MNEVIAYIYDFLAMVFEKKELKEELKEIILFGSVAKDAYDEKSDIDLFFDIKSEGKIEKTEEELRAILKSFNVKSERTWKLKKISFPINFIVGKLDDDNWKGIREEIMSYGVVLYGRYKKQPEQLKHYSLVYYSLNELKRKNKMKFIRTVFGYKIKKNRKEYKQRGLLESLNGLKVASNVILFPSEETTKIKRVFNENKIRYRIIETWVRL